MFLEPQSTAVTQDNSATSAAYSKLRHLILTGDLAPGTKLKIDALREKLGVGASPIREALSLLTSDQLVVRQDQRGFRTAETSRENFKEILELRCSLEGMALRHSMDRATSEWTEALVVAHHRMVRARSEPDANFEAQHKFYHMALIGHCGMPLLLRFCDQLYDLNIRYRNMAGAGGGYDGRNVDQEHANILTAVLDQRPDEAVSILVDHYRTTGAFLSARIE